MLLEKAKDKSFWVGIRNDPAYRPLLDTLFKQYQENTQTPLESLRYRDFRLYFENGNRSVYEAAYFNRRARLNSCALLCLLFPEKEEYLKQLQDVIWAICDEYNWAVPAHLKNWEQNLNAFIDLFAAETGFALSEIKYLLEDRLDWWETAQSNWAAGCAGSVACSFIYEWPEKWEEIKPKIDAVMECFFNSYKEDGVCREGVTYWEYGFGFFVFYADLLRQFSGGKYDYFKEKRVETIAGFAQKMFLSDNVTVSFSDGAMQGGYNLGLLHLLKSIYPDSISLPPFAYHTITDPCARWCWEFRSFLYFNKKEPEENACRDEEIYWQLSAWFIKKTKNYGFAAKAGDNGEPHNHNDVGTFLLAAGGKQLVCDLGAGEYTEQYFNRATRYQVFCNNSFSHAVPIVNGKGQKAGKDFYGSMQWSDGKLTMDMTHAYDAPELSFLKREFQFTETSVVLTDRFHLQGELTERVVTLLKPEETKRGIQIGGMCLCYDREKYRTAISQHEHFLHDGGKTVVYAVDFVPAANDWESFVLTMDFNRAACG